MGYYLADGIYPKWATIVQSISHPQELAHKFFANKHESYQKDVEQAFGVLQARFTIIRGLARFWHHEDLSFIMKVCIILHNMIIEDERVDDNELVAVAASNEDYDSLGTDGPVEVSRGPIPLINLWLETAPFEIRTPTMPSATTSLYICGRYTDKALSSEFALF